MVAQNATELAARMFDDDDAGAGLEDEVEADVGKVDPTSKSKSKSGGAAGKSGGGWGEDPGPDDDLDDDEDDLNDFLEHDVDLYHELQRKQRAARKRDPTLTEQQMEARMDAVDVFGDVDGMLAKYAQQKDRRAGEAPISTARARRTTPKSKGRSGGGGMGLGQDLATAPSGPEAGRKGAFGVAVDGDGDGAGARRTVGEVGVGDDGESDLTQQDGGEAGFHDEDKYHDDDDEYHDDDDEYHDEEALGRAKGNKSGRRAADVIDPAALERLMMTDRDEMIRSRDIPERIACREVPFTLDGEPTTTKATYDPSPATDEDWDAMADWVTEQLSLLAPDHDVGRTLYRGLQYVDLNHDELATDPGGAGDRTTTTTSSSSRSSAATSDLLFDLQLIGGADLANVRGVRLPDAARGQSFWRQTRRPHSAARARVLPLVKAVCRDLVRGKYEPVVVAMHRAAHSSVLDVGTSEVNDRHLQTKHQHQHLGTHIHTCVHLTITHPHPPSIIIAPPPFPHLFLNPTGPSRHVGDRLGGPPGARGGPGVTTPPPRAAVRRDVPRVRPRLAIHGAREPAEDAVARRRRRRAVLAEHHRRGDGRRRARRGDGDDGGQHAHRDDAYGCTYDGVAAVAGLDRAAPANT